MVVIATWNLENLYRPGGPFGPSPQAYPEKLDALAREIAAIAPDVLAVQEVGDPAALQDLVERLDGAWHVELSEHPDERGIRVGLVSRERLDHVEQVVHLARHLRPVQVDDDGGTIRSMGRGALVGSLSLPAGSAVPSITLLTCHLKSKLLSFPGGRFRPRDEDERARFAGYALNRRTAEAVTVRVAADRLLADDGRHRALVVLGDLNDEPSAATTQILQGPPGSEFDTPGFAAPDSGDGQRLWNLAARIPEASRFSRIYHGRRELIDHIFVSHALRDRLRRVDTGNARLPSIGDDPAEQRNERGSDHAPVFVDLDV